MAMTEEEKANQMNLGTFTVEDIKESIKSCVQTGLVKRPFLILGKAGIGKTESAKQAAEELGVGYKEIRLVNHTETDLLGLPITEKIADNQFVTRWAQNGMLPIESRDGKVGILVLDELTSAQRNVRTCALQLMDASRGVGDYHLPDGWLVVALGNGPGDGGNFEGLEQTLLTRAYSVRVEPSFASWHKWAINNGIHPAVVSWLGLNEELLWVAPDEEEIYGAMTPTPRSWRNLSDILNVTEKQRHTNLLPRNVVDMYTVASIGAKHAPGFARYYELNSKMIEIEDIVSRQIRGDRIGDIGLDRELWYLLCNKIIKYVHDNIITDPNSEQNIKDLASIFKFAIEAGNVVMDIAVNIIQSLSSVPEVVMMALNPKFDAMCPEFNTFIHKNAILYSTENV